MKKEFIFELLKMALQNESEICEKKEDGGMLDKECQDGTIKIAILQRGWNVIGKYYEDGDEIVMKSAWVIRRWGTSAGLGELALKGKQSETVLDEAGTVRFNKLTSIGFFDCDFEKWEKEI